MSVQNIECQIAQAQIARLLVNEPLGQAIMADLETHVAACPDCQAFIISKNRSLDVVVGDSEKPAKTKKTTKRKPEVEEAIQDNDEERLAFEKLFSPKLPKAAVETKREASTAASFWKPLAYSGALAVVLFAMSYVMKNPTALFGDRVLAPTSADAKAPASELPDNASDNRAADPTPPSAAQPIAEEAPVDSSDSKPTIMNVEATIDAEPIARDDIQGSQEPQLGAYVKAPEKPVVSNQPKPETKVVEAPRPKVTVRKLNQAPRRRPAKPRARKPVGTVQFYDVNGRPL